MKRAAIGASVLILGSAAIIGTLMLGPKPEQPTTPDGGVYGMHGGPDVRRVPQAVTTGTSEDLHLGIGDDGKHDAASSLLPKAREVAHPTRTAKVAGLAQLPVNSSSRVAAGLVTALDRYTASILSDATLAVPSSRLRSSVASTESEQAKAALSSYIESGNGLDWNAMLVHANAAAREGRSLHAATRAAEAPAADYVVTWASTAHSLSGAYTSPAIIVPNKSVTWLPWGHGYAITLTAQDKSDIDTANRWAAQANEKCACPNRGDGGTKELMGGYDWLLGNGVAYRDWLDHANGQSPIDYFCRQGYDSPLAWYSQRYTFNRTASESDLTVAVVQFNGRNYSAVIAPADCLAGCGVYVDIPCESARQATIIKLRTAAQDKPSKCIAVVEEPVNVQGRSWEVECHGN